MYTDLEKATLAVERIVDAISPGVPERERPELRSGLDCGEIGSSWIWAMSAAADHRVPLGASVMADIETVAAYMGEDDLDTQHVRAILASHPEILVPSAGG